MPCLTQVLLQVSPSQTDSSDLGWWPKSHLWVYARISASLSTTGSGFVNTSSCFLVNQAELLLRSFASHYLDRGDWSSKERMIDHLNASWPEYNRLFAHPISWSWTRRDMHKWSSAITNDYVKLLFKRSTRVGWYG